MPKGKMEYEDYLLQEKFLWFLGNEDLLADFYQTKESAYATIDIRESYYYSNVNGCIRVVHSGVPASLSFTKARLLTTGGIKHEAFNKKDEVDDKGTLLLNDILNDNDSNDLVTRSAMTESWAGRFAWKIGFESKITDYPIIEKYSPINYESFYVRGRLTKIIFKEDYTEGKKKYQLCEEYGYGYIRYKLYEVKPTSRTLVPLDTLEETAELKDNENIPNDMLLAREKRAIKSDYQGIISEFDALDETWSQLMDEIRTGRAESYVPTSLMQNKVFDKFRKHYTEVGTDNTEGVENKITHNQPNIRTEQYTKAIMAILNNILASAGLSPITMGISDGVGANSSDDALEKRETASIRTRSQMITSWQPFLEMFDMLLLESYAWWNKKSNKVEKVAVTFGKYIDESRNDKINQAATMKEAEIIDDLKALEEIYGDDLSEEEKARIVANLGSLSFEGNNKDEE
ncbi:MAG: phage portal protein [Halanaerobiales bacterium]|nr:phage portal protein [Halanaerobiales bacterium]